VPSLPHIIPIRLARLPAPFDHPAWLFELKWDGFRAVAYVNGDACRLVSRKDNGFKSFGTLSGALGRFARRP